MSTVYIYAWKNNDWDRYFYIGVGSMQRVKDTAKRSKWFSEIVSSYDCEPVVLQRFPDGSDDSFIQWAESTLKETLKSLGEPLFDGEHHHRADTMRGIAEAKKAGKYKGRKPIEVDEKLFAEQYRLWKNGETAPKFMCKKLGLSHATLYRKIKEYEIKIGIIKSDS